MSTALEEKTAAHIYTIDRNLVVWVRWEDIDEIEASGGGG